MLEFINSDFFFLFPFLMISSLTLYFIYIYKESRVRLPEESNLRSLFDFQLSGFFGSQRLIGYNYRGPFIRASFYEDFFILSTTSKMKFQYFNITKIEIGSNIFSYTLRLHHNIPEYPKVIQLRLNDSQAQAISDLISSKQKENIL
jgi:hypothetical protein